jgi:hypothetical protein
MPGHSRVVLKVRDKLSEVLIILEEQRSKKAFSITLFQSILMWLGGIVLLHIVLRFLEIEFTLIQSAYCFGFYAIFQIVPVQGIAGIGTQAAWYALALKAAGYQGIDAIALGFILYGIFYLFIAFLCLISLVFWMRGKEKI